MRSTRAAEQALRLAAMTPSQQYVCKSCRLQAARQFSTSTRAAAEKPLFARWRDNIFGSKESKEAEKSRDEKTKRRLDEMAARAPGELEKVQDKWGREYEVAALVDSSPNSQYVQAQTWDGLETVGSAEWVKARADRGERYVGFVPPKRVELSDAQWQDVLHHITIEALVLQKAGRDADEICNPRALKGKNWSHTKGATVQSTVDGGVTVSFAQAEAEEEILKAILEDESDAQMRPSHDVRHELDNVLASKRDLGEDQAWMDVSLQDPSLKLAILKRTIQLTGHRLPDPAISNAETLGDLFDALKKKPEPKKLADTPQLQRLKAELPNVSVHASRQTLVHKERKIGRWKLIEDELLTRDLPVFGTRHVGAKAYARS